MAARIVKVLIIDDSPLVRNILEKGLNQDEAIQVVGAANDPYEARDLIVRLKPDVLTLDVEMPRMNGVDFLRKLMPQMPIPTIMVSSLTESGKKVALEAMDAGAVDIVTKPKASDASSLQELIVSLCTKVKIASTANVSHWKGKAVVAPSGKVLQKSAMAQTPAQKIVALGASTGGTEAIKDVLLQFPRSMTGVVIVQHMPVGFTRMFSERLHKLCQMMVKEAEDGDKIVQGQVLIAPGGKQLEVVRGTGCYKVSIKPGPLCCGHCPSVEVMMNSVAKNVGNKAVGVMLTGMGADGAGGMLQMRQAGARCVAQDEATSVVYGMPKEAYLRGGAEKTLPLQDIPQEVMRLLKG